MKKDIENLLADHEKFHSWFQIEHFVIGSQGNAWAQYQQCLREIKSRSLILENGKDERKILKLEIKEHEFKRFKTIRKSKRLRLYYKLRLLKRNLNDFEESLYHTTRELIHFVNLAKRIKKESWGNKTITGDMRKSLEAQMWWEKAKQMLVVDIISFGQISKPTVEMLFNMPKKDRRELLELIKPEQREKLIDWAMK
jgi:hypothetical protein